MVYPILAAKHSEQIEATFLTTDDPGMAQVARYYGAEVIDRPPALKEQNIPLETILGHGYQEITSRLGTELEALVVLLANAPTVTNGLIDQAVNLFRSIDGLDAVMTVSQHQEYSPHYALRLTDHQLLRPYAALPVDHPPAVYFPDSLLWVLRPTTFFHGRKPSVRPNWVVDVETQRVAPLIHEGYGDVDYAWQIPAVEEWVRRHGFTETRTPYSQAANTSSSVVSHEPASNRKELRSDVERRVLITTVPFAQVNPHPLKALKAVGVEYVINPLGRRLKEDELAELVKDFGILIAGTEPITSRVMEAAPHLRLIARVGIGLDNVDLCAAKDRGIHVTYTPDAPSPAVAELTIGLMLSLLRDISGADRNMRNGVWHRTMGRRLSEMIVGVIGVGRIGKRVIRHLAGGFPGVQILANDISPDSNFGSEFGVRWVNKETIYRDADVITLHLPLTAQTRKLITSREFQCMKSTGLLINTSRGSLIDEQDLVDAIRSGRIAGAAIDVFDHEPYSGELVTLDRCLLTCHMGSMSQDCRSQMEIEATDEVLRFLQGEPLCRLVPETEYPLSGLST